MYVVEYFSTQKQPTMQLSFKVTFARVSHAFQTCPAHILDASRVWRKRGVALTYILLQLYHKISCLHGCISCAFQMHLAHISDMSRMRFRRVRTSPTLELSYHSCKEKNCSPTCMSSIADRCSRGFLGSHCHNSTSIVLRNILKYPISPTL